MSNGASLKKTRKKSFVESKDGSKKKKRKKKPSHTYTSNLTRHRHI